MSNSKSKYVMNWRNRTKQKLVEYKGGKCQICGYNKPIWSAYDFHHRDPSKKDFSLSGKSWSFEKLKNEVDKCDVLCKICHAEVHWMQTQDERKERLKIVAKESCVSLIVCKFCEKEVKASWFGAKCCSVSCAKMLSRKVERPTSEELLNLLKENSWLGVGRKYNVSDNAIRKWAKQYEIYDLVNEWKMNNMGD